MLNFDGTFGLILISFVVFMLLMKAVYFDPVQKIKDERTKKIETDHSHAQTYSLDREALITSYEAALKEARQKAQTLMVSSRETSKKQVDGQVASAKSQAHQQLNEQLGLIAEQREAVYASLASERTELVGLMISKLGVSELAIADKSVSTKSTKSKSTKTPASSLEH